MDNSTSQSSSPLLEIPDLTSVENEGIESLYNPHTLVPVPLFPTVFTSSKWLQKCLAFILSSTMYNCITSMY